MEALLVGVGSAFLLGLQTAISPCPMATNIAAISFIGRRVTSARSVFLAGLLYALGRTVAYVGLAILLLTSLFARTDLSAFLRTTMNQLLGPILIVVAMFLLDLIRLNFSGPGVSEKLQKRVEAWGLWAALAAGHRLRPVVLPVFGRAVLRPDPRGRGQQLDGRGPVDLRSGHSPAGRFLCPGYRLQRPVTRQGLQPAGPDRVVDAADHGRRLPGGRDLLHAGAHL